MNNNTNKHIADINSEHYALQTSLYQHILISGGYFPKDTQFDNVLTVNNKRDYIC